MTKHQQHKITLVDVSYWLGSDSELHILYCLQVLAKVKTVLDSTG